MRLKNVLRDELRDFAALVPVLGPYWGDQGVLRFQDSLASFLTASNPSLEELLWGELELSVEGQPKPDPSWTLPAQLAHQTLLYLVIAGKLSMKSRTSGNMLYLARVAKGRCIRSQRD